MARAMVRVVAICVSLLVSVSAGAAKFRYDVSYLWNGDLRSVSAYRSKVARVLGPRVARKLRIAKEQGLYGLIYNRRGDSLGAVRVARRHTHLLRSRGLEAAAPIRSRHWDFLGENSTVRTAHATQPQPVRRSRERDLSNLEAAVAGYIKQSRRRGMISSDERTAWSVYDFTSGEKLVGINEDVQFQAASLVKPFFALAFFHKVARGELYYGPVSRRHMERMIQHSNNKSANWVLRRVGGPRAVQRILTQEFPGIFQDTHIVEYIPRNGRTYRNKASAHDYSRFLYALWKGEIPGSEEIKRLMALPGPDRIRTGASAVPRGTRVYNKTGSTARLCGDMGILVVHGADGRRYPYTLIGVIEKQGRARNYGRWIRSRGNVIRKVSNLVFEGIAQHHGLSS